MVFLQRPALWMCVLLAFVLLAHSSEVHVLDDDLEQVRQHDLGVLQRRALVVAQDLGLSTSLQAKVARAAKFSQLDTVFGAASFVEIDEGGGQQDLADLIGNSGSLDMSLVMRRIQALENEIVLEDTKAQSALGIEMERLNLQLQELNTQIGAAEEERKVQTLAEREQHAARESARLERTKSRTLERGIEKVLHEMRLEKQQEWDAYVARRDKRRKDVMVLHTAIQLVCNFNTFEEEDRCKKNKISMAVPLPLTTAIHADMSEEQLKQEATEAQQDSTAWETQRETDEENIRDGTLPSDYVYDQDGMLKKSTLLSLVQTGSFDQEAISQRILGLEASARATAPLQTLLMSMKEGDFEKSSNLLDLVIGLVDEVEKEQHEDGKQVKHEQEEIDVRIGKQDAAQQAEETRQEELHHQSEVYLTNAIQAKQQAYVKVREIKLREKQAGASRKQLRQVENEFWAKKEVRDEELTNIERLRSLLLVLTGAANPPDCDNTSMNQCTNSEQGMCIFATGPVKRDTEAYCACEFGYYGEACEYRKCPGKVQGSLQEVLFKHTADAACGGLEMGSCDKATGQCSCEDHATGKACSKFLSCPGGGITCSGHGSCDLKIGKCLCGVNYYGDACEKMKCLGAEMNGMSPRFVSGDPSTCSGRGICGASGFCECLAGHLGAHCNKKECMDDCSGRGSCNQVTGMCACDPGFSGASCRYRQCPDMCNGDSNGHCDRDAGICRCRPGFSGPSCAKSTTCRKMDTSYKEWSFFKPGWSKCPHGSLVTGLKTGTCTSIDCIDQARCARPCAGKKELEIHHCYQANWWTQLDSQGWAKCREPYFVAGLWRNKCNSLYCIEMGLCCSLKGASWTSCGHTKEWRLELDKPGNWAEVPPNHILTGIYRRGLTAEVKDLHQASHCSFKLDAQIEA